MSNRRVIDLTETELHQLLGRALVAHSGNGTEAPDPDAALPRKQAAALLAVSLTTLDLLSRKDRPDPIPFSIVGESRRYLRSDLVAWLKRQRQVAA